LKLRTFMLFFLSIIFVCVLFFCLISIGLGYAILQNSAIAVIQLVIGLSIGTFGLVIGEKLRLRVTKADDAEIKREDDVLLQAVGFSQSVLLIMVNFFLVEQSVLFSILIITSSVGFYSLRAWAKIKNSQVFRYFSMFFLAMATSNTLIFPFLSSFMSLDLGDYFLVVYLGILLAFTSITRSVFTKRYGLKF